MTRNSRTLWGVGWNRCELLDCFRKWWCHWNMWSEEHRQTDGPPSLLSDVWGEWLYKRPEKQSQFYISTHTYFCHGDDSEKGDTVRLSFYWQEEVFSICVNTPASLLNSADMDPVWFIRNINIIFDIFKGPVHLYYQKQQTYFITCRNLRHVSSMLTGRQCQLVVSSLHTRFTLRYLDDYWIDSNEIWHRYLYAPLDEF